MRRLLVFLLMPLVLLAPAPPRAAAQQATGPIRFVAPEAGFVRVDARFARKPDICPARQPKNLHAAYPGVLEVGRRADGRLYLVSELSFRRYLEGIAEVPRDWPAEALKAQVVAARTYAMGHLNPATAIARELNYNLCATDACQVYRGLNVAGGAWGEAWVGAVAETEGEILEHGGRPARTFYFSTSNGRTYSNAEIFGGTPLPYLRQVTETDDAASPLRTWEARMPLSDLAQTLRLAGAWGGGPVEAVAQEGETIRVAGGGGEAAMTAEQFRRRLNAQAVCLTPKRYPTIGPSGRSLPQVVPSRWFTVAQEGAGILIRGEGWGHGVGMVQWGLKGKAERGLGHAEMLAFYFGGLRPVHRDEPETIRVGLAVDLEEIVIERSEGVRVEGASVPGGPLRITGGPSLTIAEGNPISPVLAMTKVTGPSLAEARTPATFSFELSDPASVSIGYRDASGTRGSTARQARDRGPQSVIWDASGLPPGTYRLALVANDGVDEITSSEFEVTVPPVPPSPAASPSATRSSVAAAERRPRSAPVLRVVGLVALGLTAALLLARSLRKPRT